MNINKLMEEFEKEFMPHIHDDTPEHFYITSRSFLRSSLHSLCDEILAAVPEQHLMGVLGDADYMEGAGWNSCRQAIESKVKEIKGTE